MKRAKLFSILVATLAVLFAGSVSWCAAEVLPTHVDPAIASQRGSETTSQLPAGVSTNWWAKARADIQRSEYRVTWQEKTRVEGLGPAWQAPNRAQNLRTYFTRDGALVIPRTDSNPTWQWGIRLAGWGYEGVLAPVAAAEPVVQGNRVEYRRPQITEWYVNDERGLEQGFTIPAPPATEPAAGGANLVLELALSGGLKANLQDRRVTFTTTRGGVRVIDFGDLRATDAGGRELPSRFAVSGSRLLMVMDGAGATYPLTVDPLATTPSWTAEGDQEYAQFGYSVSTAGDVNGDGYGDVIVGAPYYDHGELTEGAAYVYYGSSGGLSATANWTAEGNQKDALFGCSVSTAGDVNGDGDDDIIIGAYGYGPDQTGGGHVYVYYGSPEGLGPDPDWTVEGDQPQSRFGNSVSTAGDVNGDDFDDVIIGANFYDTAQEDEGAAFVYHGSAEGLSAEASWTAEGDQAGARFGDSVSRAGDVNGDGYDDVIIGASLYDHTEENEGAAFVYHGSGIGLRGSTDEGDPDTPGTAVWNAWGGQAGARFGSSVSMAGKVNDDAYSDVIVGAPHYTNGEPGEGAAFVYHGSEFNGLSAIADWTAEGDQASALFGSSVSTAGDVNGDGFSEVIVGARDYGNGEEAEGAVFIYHGSAVNGLSATADWTVEGDQAHAHFGSSVSTAGDVNGDGFSDVIAGADYFSNGETNEGAAFVYHGSAGGLSAEASWTAEGDQEICTISAFQSRQPGT